jgi:hypothetical protein
MNKKIPSDYYAGLTKSNAQKQKKYIRTSQKQAKLGIYKTRPIPQSYKHKPSKHTVDFNNIYKFHISNSNKISRIIGVSTSKQKAILSKGRGAYFSSGSKPGQTPSSWAYARLASALLGRSACKVDQHILLPLKCSELKLLAKTRTLKPVTAK